MSSSSTPCSRRRIAAAIGLGALAVLAAALLSPPVILRLKAAYHLHELESGDEQRVERAFRAFTEELPPGALHLLCDAVESSPPRPLHFQIARVIHARCGEQLPLESTTLPTASELRQTVKSKFARDADAGAGKP